jgi:hypothetical protein
MSIEPATYLPREDSLPWRVCAYFARLPDEELSIADVALKWASDPKNVPTQLSKAVESGLLVRSGAVYMAGPDIARMNEAVKPPATSPLIAAGPKRASRHKPPEIDIESIEFVTVPLPTVRPMHDRWMDKVRTMQPGHHFAVDMCHAHALRAVATALRKEGKSIRILMNQPSEGEDKKVGVYCLKEKSA